jgi:hypothetical protein
MNITTLSEDDRKLLIAAISQQWIIAAGSKESDYGALLARLIACKSIILNSPG